MKLVLALLPVLFVNVALGATTIECGKGLDQATGLLNEVSLLVSSEEGSFSGPSGDAWTLKVGEETSLGAFFNQQEDGTISIKHLYSQIKGNSIGAEFVIKSLPSDQLFASAGRYELTHDLHGRKAPSEILECVRTTIKE
ncbi:MAG: hypothetical protein V4692_04225 [Bdellovibrionota bacterium]